jgi:hypothetical protein
MKKTILALAAAGLVPLAAGAFTPESSAPPPPPGSSAPPAGTTPAPTRFEPKTTFGDVARVLSSQPVYERTPQSRCRMEGTGYSSVSTEPAPCDDAAGGGERIVAYDVTYQYMGRDFRVRMPFDPGEQMAVNVEVRPPGQNPRSGYRIPQTRGPY